MSACDDTQDDLLPEALRFRSPTPLVDIGANLTHESFAKDLDATLTRARRAGVETMVLTGTDLAHAHQAAELAKHHPGLYATAGCTPTTRASGLLSWKPPCALFTASPRSSP